MKKVLIALAAVAIVVVAPEALAGTSTANLTVNAAVPQRCTISTTSVAFGTYDVFSASPLTAGGTVVVSCTKGASTLSVGLDLGLHPTGSLRYMKDSVSLDTTLNYELYQPPNNGQPAAACVYPGTVWGTTGGNLFSLPNSTGKAARTYNVCGSIPAGQDVTAASGNTYTDTVIATVNF